MHYWSTYIIKLNYYNDHNDQIIQKRKKTLRIKHTFGQGHTLMCACAKTQDPGLADGTFSQSKVSTHSWESYQSTWYRLRMWSCLHSPPDWTRGIYYSALMGTESWGKGAVMQLWGRSRPQTHPHDPKPILMGSPSCSRCYCGVGDWSSPSLHMKKELARLPRQLPPSTCPSCPCLHSVHSKCSASALSVWLTERNTAWCGKFVIKTPRWATYYRP